VSEPREPIGALDEPDLRSLASREELRKLAIGLFSKNL